jgi:hypothetical protein
MITLNPTQLDKIEIHEMENQKDENDYTSIYHIFGEKRCLGRVGYPVP